jgi:hypothetical protein
MSGRLLNKVSIISGDLGTSLHSLLFSEGIAGNSTPASKKALEFGYSELTVALLT